MALPEGMMLRALEDVDFQLFLDIQSDALRNAPEVFGSDYEWFEALSILSKEQRFEKYMMFPYKYLLGAFTVEGVLVGMIGFSNDRNRSKIRHKAQIWGLYVLPENRGSGIACALVRSVVETAQEIGVELIQLSVSTRNTESYALYLRSGFVVYGTEVRAMKVQSDYIDEYLMVKFLR